MKLAEAYSLACGLPLDKPVIYESFYPLSFDNYIVIHPSSGHAAKNYDYWQLVIDFISQKDPTIKFIQLGGTDDTPLERCVLLNGKTSISQTAYIIKRARILLGNDSLLVHMAGALDVPVVSLYGPTSASNHGPYWKNEKSVLLEPDRGGKNPSFHFNEPHKTVNSIKPEDVTNACLSILDVGSCSVDSLHMGGRLNDRLVEVCPDTVVNTDFLSDAVLNIRADYVFNPNNIYNQVSVRKSLIYTDKPLDVNILARVKGNLTGVVYEVTKEDHPEFCKDVRKAGISISLVTKMSDEELTEKKIGYFDVGIIHKVPVFSKESIQRAGDITGDTLFKTNKLLLSNGKVYLSNSHRLMDIEVTSNERVGKVIDFPKFYEEVDFFYIFNKKSVDISEK